MSRRTASPRPQARPRPPSIFDTARRFYGAAFDATDDSELAEAMADWSRLTPAEHAFAIAQLAYLGLRAQERVLRELADVNDGLEDLQELLDVWLDEPDTEIADPPAEEHIPAEQATDLAPEVPE